MVSSDNNGYLVAWDLQSKLAKEHGIRVHGTSNKPGAKQTNQQLTLVQSMPGGAGNVLVVAENDILMVNIKGKCVKESCRYSF